MLEIEALCFSFWIMLFEADYAKNYASILYQCLAGRTATLCGPSVDLLGPGLVYYPITSHDRRSSVSWRHLNPLKVCHTKIDRMVDGCLPP